AVGVRAEVQRPLIGQHLPAVRADPFIAGDDRARLAPFGFHQLLVLDSPLNLGRLGPEVDAVHLAVREPERALVRVIGLLVRISRAHRPGAGHLFAGRADDRPQDWLDPRFEDVPREGVVADFDVDSAVDLLNDNVSSRGDTGGESEYRKQRGNQKGGAHGGFLRRSRPGFYPGCDRTRRLAVSPLL